MPPIIIGEDILAGIFSISTNKDIRPTVAIENPIFAEMYLINWLCISLTNK